MTISMKQPSWHDQWVHCGYTWCLIKKHLYCFLQLSQMMINLHKIFTRC